jgi:hypothetical protein
VYGSSFVVDGLGGYAIIDMSLLHLLRVIEGYLKATELPAKVSGGFLIVFFCGLLLIYFGSVCNYLINKGY